MVFDPLFKFNEAFDWTPREICEVLSASEAFTDEERP